MVPLQKPGVLWHFLPSLEQGLAAFLRKGQMVNISGSAAQKASLLAASSLTRSSSSFFTAPVKLFLAIGHSKSGHQLDVACRPSCASLTHTSQFGGNILPSATPFALCHHRLFCGALVGASPPSPFSWTAAALQVAGEFSLYSLVLDPASFLRSSA